MPIISHCFTGTGNTQRTAEIVGQALAEALGMSFIATQFTLPEERKQPMSADVDNIYLIGVPVIAGRVPNLLLPYLKALRGNGALAIPFVTYGNRAFDDALSELTGILKDNHFRILAAGAFIGRHTFAHKLAFGRPDEKDLQVMRQFARDIAEKIRKGTYTEPTVPGAYPPGPYYQPRDSQGKPISIVKITPKTTDACNDCKICSLACPLGSIDYEDCSIITGPCMKCGACVEKCPVEAKYFDDPGYLYHKEDLENLYLSRQEPSVFL